MSLAALGYACLALDLLRRSNEARERTSDTGYVEVRTPQPRVMTLGGGDFNAALFERPEVAMRGASAVMQGGRVSAEAARQLSPTFQGRAQPRGVLHNVPSLDGRLAKIKQQIRKGALDPAVRATAIGVLSQRCPQKAGGWCVPEKNWEAEAKALFDFTRKNVRYTRDSQLADTYVAAARTLFDVKPGSGGGGDCDDYTITLGALLGSVGHGVLARVGAVKADGQPDAWNHIWLVAELPSGGAIAGGGGKLLPLDASVDKPAGWEAPKARLHRTKDYRII